MISRAMRLRLTVLLVLGMQFMQSACTFVGLGLGSALDAGNKQTFAPDSFGTGTIESDKTYKFRLRDGGIVEGKDVRIERLSAEEYAERYAMAREQYLMNVPLPELGDTVTLCMISEGELDAEFLGFDFYKVSVRKLGESGPESVKLDDIDTLQVRGHAAIPGETLALLLSEGALPSHSAFVTQAQPGIGRAGGKRVLPTDEVLLIEWKPNARMVLTLVGLTIDIGLFTALLIGMSSMNFSFY